MLGAPEVLMAGDGHASALGRAGDLARTGHRVLLVARAPRPPDDAVVPAGLEPAALVALGEKVRPDASDTLAYSADQGVPVKAISGDNPGPVGAIPARVGLP